MRPPLVCLLVMMFSLSAHAQVVTPAPPVGTRQAYLLKSQNQRTAARVLLIGGGVLMGAAIVLGNQPSTSFDDLGLIGIVGVTGSAAVLSSIPLFLAAGRNKAKAATAVSLQLRLCPAPLLPASSPPYPALTLHFSR